MADTMNMVELRKEIAACRKELFELKLGAAAGQVKDTSQFKKMRKKVARLLTQVKGVASEQAQNENAQQ